MENTAAWYISATTVGAAMWIRFKWVSDEGTGKEESQRQLMQFVLSVDETSERKVRRLVLIDQ